MVAVDDEALKFFNHLSCTLQIELSKPPSQIAPNLLNRAAPQSAEITNIAISAQVSGDDCEDPARDLTPSEWSRVHGL